MPGSELQIFSIFLPSYRLLENLSKSFVLSRYSTTGFHLSSEITKKLFQIKQFFQDILVTWGEDIFVN